MEVTKTDIGPIIIEPKVFGDERGYFYESFNLNEFKLKTGIDFNPVQDNESKSCKGVLRGLHFQKPPYAQAKLVRVAKGAVYDVAVDIRKGSPTYGKYVGVFLTEDNKKQFFLPKGFAHGFLALTDEVVFQYKCDNYYNKESEGAVLYNDENINIDWNTIAREYDIPVYILSDKDKNNKPLLDIESPFFYAGNDRCYVPYVPGMSPTDESLFMATKYEGMPFIRLDSWLEFDRKYTSPRFKFENGDIVVFDKFGNLNVL